MADSLARMDLLPSKEGLLRRRLKVSLDLIRCRRPECHDQGRLVSLLPAQAVRLRPRLAKHSLPLRRHGPDRARRHQSIVSYMSMNYV